MSSAASSSSSSDMPSEHFAKHLRLAERGDGDAMAEVGRCYMLAEFGVAKDVKLARSWFRRAADAGSGDGMVCLAGLYQKGEGVKQCNGTAHTWFLKAAQIGYSRAFIHMGECYVDGIGVKKNFATALKWYTRAADAGMHVTVCHRIGQLFLAGGFGVEKNVTKAFELFRHGAEFKDDMAMNSLAGCFRNGSGVAKDDKMAVFWYHRASEAGNDMAMCNLADCYAFGIGTDKDERTALEWYRRAADAGNAEAMRQLAIRSENIASASASTSSTSGVVDDKQTFNDYLRAAKKGSPEAMHWLGIYYNENKDFKKAAHWFRLAPMRAAPSR
jgi:TPR repeat protein